MPPQVTEWSISTQYRLCNQVSGVSRNTTARQRAEYLYIIYIHVYIYIIVTVFMPPQVTEWSISTQYRLCNQVSGV